MIFPIYSPIIPSMSSTIPKKKNIAHIREDQPTAIEESSSLRTKVIMAPTNPPQANKLPSTVDMRRGITV